MRTLEGAVCSVAVSLEGSQVAAGLWSGKVVVLKARTLKPVLERKDRKAAVAVLRYSNSGKLLAAGGEEGFIDVYDVGSDYEWVGTCSGHAGPIRDLDWSVDRSTSPPRTASGPSTTPLRHPFRSRRSP